MLEGLMNGGYALLLADRLQRGQDYISCLSCSWLG